MLRIHRPNRSLIRLERTTLSELTLTERYDLQELIFNSPQQFFPEVGFDLFVLAKELTPSQFVQDRIDLLALDKQGNGVIIELKRGNNKLQLLQAISYAALISEWKPEQFEDLLDENALESLKEFLAVDVAEINSRQRILLIAEAYDFEVLKAAEWLHNNYSVDITCARLSLSKDDASGAEYLHCSLVFPSVELAQQAITRRSVGTKAPWEDWDEALAAISNPAVTEFFQAQLQLNQDSNLRKRMLTYRVGSKRRFFIWAKMDHAYCWQEGRFDNDLNFWSKQLARPESVAAVKEGSSLRFSLCTTQDFSTFVQAVTSDLRERDWLQLPTSEESELSVARAVSAS